MSGLERGKKSDCPTHTLNTFFVSPPSRDAYPCLIRVAGDDVGRWHPLKDKYKFSIGRSKECDIRIADEEVSRRQVELTIMEDCTIRVIDLNSTNGTFVNGTRVQECVLTEGDKVQIGFKTIFRLSYFDEYDEICQNHLYQSSIRDYLTGLYNKRFFLESVEREYRYQSRLPAPMTLAMIDIDDFKEVNDTFGHIAGDIVLKEIGRILKNMQRSESIFARYGGDEFALLLRNVDAKGSRILTDRMKSKVSRLSFLIGGRKVKVSISIGVVSCEPETCPTSQDLISMADEMLYRAKDGGKNKIERAIYSPDEHLKIIDETCATPANGVKQAKEEESSRAAET